MSNHLAVAMVTSALGRTLSEAMAAGPAGGVQNARVTTQRPQTLAATDTDAGGVNVFLYRVVANGARSAAELPARRGDGVLVNRPRQALDLHYLLTFYGNEPALEPQRLLGLAVSTLTLRPVLGREVIGQAVRQAVEDDPAAWQQYADLADQLDAVRLTLLPLNLEELTKLWSMFSHTPYRLSVAYQAVSVLLDGPGTPMPPAREVSDRMITVSPSAGPPAAPAAVHGRAVER
ncbi:DUF4255 domain-containing protein [Microbispora sp. NPDC049125]|uniref:DUF4255 domain-containing protein n=1 Tax=Microbispora sp. NPDC049125 TaxID=3154929 RepID=UPI0034660816